MAEIEFVDQTLRDGPQSLWGLRMYAGQMTAAAPYLDRAGFRVIEIQTGACEHLLRESKWDRLDWMRTILPNSKLRHAKRTMASGGMGFTPDCVLDLLVQTYVKHGVDSILVLDTMYNMDWFERFCRTVADTGAEVVPMIVWDDSPYLPDEYFVERVRTMRSWGIVDAFMFEDTTGVLLPQRAGPMMQKLVDAAGPTPFEMHCHNTTGLAPMNYVEAVNAGVRILHTASRPLANGSSLPSMEGTVENLDWLGHTAVLNTTVMQPVAEHFTRVARQEGHPLETLVEWPAGAYQYHVPGGMMSNLQRQLSEQNMDDRLSEVLREIPRVRLELGSPISATPMSQFIGIQAVLNIASGDRYSMVPDEIVGLMAGHYGPPPGPIDDNIKDRVLSSPRGQAALTWQRPQPTLAQVREQYGRDCSDEELLDRYIDSPADLAATRAAGPLKTTYEFLDDTTVEGLIKEILPRTRLGHVHCRVDGFSLTMQKT
jgi:oxaloacetate decarboxylase alpha subunit